MGFSWKDAYSIGNAKIDAEHQRLFVLADNFSEAKDRAARTECAAQLFDYTRVHFGHEEALMRETNYPDIDAHTAQHQHLIARLTAVAEQVANDTLNPAELKSFLTGWLVGHIVTFDTKLASAVGKLKGAHPAT